MRPTKKERILNIYFRDIFLTISGEYYAFKPGGRLGNFDRFAIPDDPSRFEINSIDTDNVEVKELGFLNYFGYETTDEFYSDLEQECVEEIENKKG